PPLSSLRLPPPPTPTLFPYTTLFRSRAAGGRSAAAQPPRPHLGRAHPPRRLAAGLHRRVRRQRVGAGRAPGHWRHARSLGRVRPDRKSTRLNSSHVSISYAVFCLKKK